MLNTELPPPHFVVPSPTPAGCIAGAPLMFTSRNVPRAGVDAMCIRVLGPFSSPSGVSAFLIYACSSWEPSKTTQTVGGRRSTCRGGPRVAETHCWLCCQWALLWVLCRSGCNGLAVLRGLSGWRMSDSIVQCPLWKHDHDITLTDQLWPGSLGTPAPRDTSSQLLQAQGSTRPCGGLA